jgi:hypothetical protein
MALLTNPRGWSKRFAAAQIRAAGDPVRAHNDAQRLATIRRHEIVRDLAAGKITQDQADAQMAEVEEALTRPAPVAALAAAPAASKPEDGAEASTDGGTEGTGIVTSDAADAIGENAVSLGDVLKSAAGKRRK